MYFSYPHMFTLWKDTFLLLQIYWATSQARNKQMGWFFLWRISLPLLLPLPLPKHILSCWQRSYARCLCFCLVPNLILMSLNCIFNCRVFKKVRCLYFIFFSPNGFRCNISLQFSRISTDLHLKNDGYTHSQTYKGQKNKFLRAGNNFSI